MQNWQRILLSQYANSLTLLALIESANDAIDPVNNINTFYDSIWNIKTAQGVGLDIWGRIVGVGRMLTIPGGKTFGFEEMGTTDADPFNQSAFYLGVPVTANYALSDDFYRVLILAKAAANIGDGSIKSYNAILMALFPGRGNAYVVDNGNMAATLHFEFALAPFEIAIIGQSGALAPPTGVLFNVVHL